jgi:hypothetical protein
MPRKPRLRQYCVLLLGTPHEDSDQWLGKWGPSAIPADALRLHIRQLFVIGTQGTFVQCV